MRFHGFFCEKMVRANMWNFHTVQNTVHRSWCMTWQHLSNKWSEDEIEHSVKKREFYSDFTLEKKNCANGVDCRAQKYKVDFTKFLDLMYHAFPQCEKMVIFLILLHIPKVDLKLKLNLHIWKNYCIWRNRHSQNHLIENISDLDNVFFKLWTIKFWNRYICIFWILTILIILQRYFVGAKNWFARFAF